MTDKISKVSFEKLPTPNEPKPQEEIIKEWISESPVLISVVCIAYNQKEFIGDALNGILNQSSKYPFEVIVRDDASTDGTREIIAQYAERYPQIIRFFPEEENRYSQGVSPQREVFMLTRGDFIAYCEGDDYWLGHSKIERQVEAMMDDDSIVFSYHRTVCINQNGLVIGEKDRVRDLSADDIVENPYGIAQVSKMYKNLPCLKEGKFPVNGPTGDATLNVFLAGYGRAVYVEGCGEAVYRIHAGGVWSGKSGTEKKQMTTAAFAKMYGIAIESKNRRWIETRESELRRQLCRSQPFYSILYSLKVIAFRPARRIHVFFRACLNYVRMNIFNQNGGI